MEQRILVCIGRQYGSGGREIGEKLAQALGVPCYDKMILKRAAAESGIAESIFEDADERARSWFSSAFWSGNTEADFALVGALDYLTDDKLFQIQTKTIRELAKEKSGVFIGRCAEYILAQDPNMLSVFIHGDPKDRIARIAKRQNVSEREAERLMGKADRNRAHYHNFYCDTKWGDCDSYHLSVSSSAFGIAGAVAVIRNSVAQRLSRG